MAGTEGVRGGGEQDRWHVLEDDARAGAAQGSRHVDVSTPPLVLDPALRAALTPKRRECSPAATLCAAAFTNPALTGKAAMGPAMTPFAQLRTRAQLDAAIARENAFLSTVGAWAAPLEREAHQRYVADLEKVRDGGSGTAHERLAEQGEKRLAGLREELGALGVRCTGDESEKTLLDRRSAVMADRVAQRDAADAQRLNIGLDGRVGTRDAVDHYETQQWVAAANPGSGTGVVLAAVATMRGGSLDDVRASGQAGNDIEGIAGGVGHTLNRDRPLVDDRRVRGTTGRAPGSGPPSRVRAQIVPNGGLRTHEDRGGHTLQKHVDKSVAELAERLVREKRITGSSSFSGRESAESAIAGALEANDGAIKSWLASGPSRPLVIRHSEAAPVGVSLPRGAAQPVPASKLVVVLMPDAGTSTGYRIHTAYPTL